MKTTTDARYSPLLVPHPFATLPVGARFRYPLRGGYMYCKLALDAAQAVEPGDPHCGTVFYLSPDVTVLTA